jgi:hypothetical protein
MKACSRPPTRHCRIAVMPVNDASTVAGRPSRGRSAAGPVAQWLEPAAHNGLVAGSSPAGPTSLRSLRELWLGRPAHRKRSERRLPRRSPSGEGGLFRRAQRLGRPPIISGRAAARSTPAPFPTKTSKTTPCKVEKAAAGEDTGDTVPFDTSGKSAALFHHRAICKTAQAVPIGLSARQNPDS